MDGLAHSIRKMVSYRRYLDVLLRSGWYELFHHRLPRQTVAIPDSACDFGQSFSSHPLTRALHTFYVRQFNEAACSVATMTMVLNAARAEAIAAGRHETIRQQDLLRQVTVADWRDRVSPKGFQNRRGMPIDKLGIVARQTFRQFGVTVETLRIIPLFGKGVNPGRQRSELFQCLSRFRKSGRDLLIAHFNQGVFLQGLHLPHVSPVGDVDPLREMVCLLDVDPEVPEPYWVSFQTFWKGVSWRYSGAVRRHGYEGGGYIWIRLKN